jgi:hypothetical protein
MLLCALGGRICGPARSSMAAKTSMHGAFQEPSERVPGHVDKVRDLLDTERSWIAPSTVRFASTHDV